VRNWCQLSYSSWYLEWKEAKDFQVELRVKWKLRLLEGYIGEFWIKAVRVFLSGCVLLVSCSPVFFYFFLKAAA
jgi:hypothetical protein